MDLEHDVSKLMVVSREAKKKQHMHACMSSGLHNHYSAWMTALKFENAVTQPL